MFFLMIVNSKKLSIYINIVIKNNREQIPN